MSDTSLKEKTAKGLFWGGFSNGIQQLLNLGFGIVLARLLDASDYGMDQETAGAVTSVTLIFIAALLTGLDLYNSIARFAGAGTLVPITGFSNGVVSPALEFKSEGLVLGLGAKLFVIAGPVIVYGISASIVYGLILYLFKLY